MRNPALLLLLLTVAACREGQQAHAPASNAVEIRPAATAGNKVEPAPPAATPKAGAPARPPDDYPGVAGMSPPQRRAYEQGYRDCRAGRYAPDAWAEAYRIGCAAAQEAG